jgi:hypothetical protein
MKMFTVDQVSPCSASCTLIISPSQFSSMCIYLLSQNLLAAPRDIHSCLEYITDDDNEELAMIIKFLFFIYIFNC